MPRRLLISGVVQGVGYRWSAKRQAEQLGLHGWVRNLPTGQVEALVDGDATRVAEFEEWGREGPPAAEVSVVSAADVPGDAPAGFEIRR